MSRKATKTTVALTISVLVLGLVLFGVVKCVRVWGHVSSLRQHLAGLENTAKEDLFADQKVDQLQGLRAELTQVENELTGLRAELGPVLGLARYLYWLPVVGGDMAAASDLVDMGIGVASAGSLVLEGLEPSLALFGSSEDAGPEGVTGERLTRALVDAQPQFVAAQAELDRVRQLREGIDDERLSPRMGRLLERFDRYLPLLESGLQGLLMAPDLLGAREPRTYLLLAQNDNELRATGGFISSVALLRVADGEIVEVDFGDSYAVDDLSQPHPLAPEPLEKYMLAQVLLIRDANWYPDFPTSAVVARDLYQLDQGMLVEGVIAADLTALESLVAVLGPVRLDEYGVEVGAANVTDLMREYWASPEGLGQTGDWWIHRKDFMGELLTAMLVKLETDMGSVDLSQLMEVLSRGLREKHILIYLTDPALSEVLAENHWDGAIRSTSGDFLMVVDTNMGFNKVNPSIESSVRYQVLVSDDGSLDAEVAVSYGNKSSVEVEHCVQEARYPPSYEEMMEGCYWNYLRVYVPQNGQLVRGPQLTLPEGSLRAADTGLGGTPLAPRVGPVQEGKNVFATFFVVPPGEKREMVFRYELPSEILEKRDSRAEYRLLVQKQPGTLGIPLHVTVTLPVGSEVLSTDPPASCVTDGKVEFQTDLRVDREFSIVFR